MDRTALVSATAHNLLLHFSWLHAHTEGMDARSCGALRILDSGLNDDTFNLMTTPAGVLPADCPGYERELEHFATTGQGFSWWVPPDEHQAEWGVELMSQRLHRTELLPSMVLDLRAKPAPPALYLKGFRIEQVANAATLSDLISISGMLWEPPNPIIHTFYMKAAPAILSAGCPLHYFVGYLEDLPVCSGEVVLDDHGTAGLYWIATRPTHRGAGYGSAITEHLIHHAQTHGCQRVVLQASDMGVGIYRRLGFEDIGRYWVFQ